LREVVKGVRNFQVRVRVNKKRLDLNGSQDSGKVMELAAWALRPRA
jgi:hypothetical protein